MNYKLYCSFYYISSKSWHYSSPHQHLNSTFILMCQSAFILCQLNGKSYSIIFPQNKRNRSRNYIHMSLMIRESDTLLQNKTTLKTLNKFSSVILLPFSCWHLQRRAGIWWIISYLCSAFIRTNGPIMIVETNIPIKQVPTY